MTENSLIELYCIVDDFIHRFLETTAFGLYIDG